MKKPELCLIAVKRNRIALEFIQEQTEELCLAAIEEDPFAFEHVAPEFKEGIYKKLRLRALFDEEIYEVLNNYEKVSS